jgi:hypothetical protein
MTATLARLCHRHAILARCGEPNDMVSPDDFDLAFEAAFQPADMPADTLCYCADFAAERLLYTILPEPSLTETLHAPFLFSAQHQRATGIVTVPFERLDYPAGAPVLVFSPGRTGSTLLTRLLTASGAGCASEPDLPTQLCRLDEAAQARLTPAIEKALICAAMMSLARALGPAPFVKLRSQCNARPEILLQALPHARPVFLFRRHIAWALSRHRAFAEPPDMVADILRTAVVAVDRLTRAGHAPHILWFEDMVADPARFLADLLQDRAMTRRALAPRLTPVMARDSQEGTSLARSVVQARDIDAAFLAGFKAEWAERRPTHHLGQRLEALLELLEQT